MEGITTHHCESPIDPGIRTEEKLVFHRARLAESNDLSWQEYHQRRVEELERILVERNLQSEIEAGIITEKGPMSAPAPSKVAVTQPPAAPLATRVFEIRTNGPSPGADALHAIAAKRIAPMEEGPNRKRSVTDERLGHIALSTCFKCHGAGRYLGRKTWNICNCVFRTVFRLCIRKHHYEEDKYYNHIVVYRGTNGLNASYPNLEFVADVEKLAKKALGQLELKVFWLHHIFGQDWKFCTYRLHIDRGTFFHAVYRAEQVLGQEFMAHGLFPTDAYFTKPRDNCMFQERSGKESARSSHEWRDGWLSGGHYFDQTPEQMEAYHKSPGTFFNQGNPWRKKG